VSINKSYGKELILDLADCNTELFNEDKLTEYVEKVTDLVEMKRVGNPFFWADWLTKEKHLHGISCFQFIETSNIVIHALDLLGKVCVNLFACKDFDSQDAIDFTRDFFGGKIINVAVLVRG